MARLVAKVRQPQQDQGGNAIARGRGIVEIRLGALDELFVIVAGEIKAAALPVFKLFEQYLGQAADECQIVGAEIRLQHLEDRLRQIGVVVEIGIEMGLAVLVGGVEALAAGVPHGRAHEGQRLARRGQPGRFPEHARGMRHALDHQRVPAGQDFFIAPWMDALRARGKQFLPRGLQQHGAIALGLAQGIRNHRQRLRRRQVPEFFFKISAPVEAVIRRRHLPFRRGQQRPRCIRRPHIELALMTFRIGIQGRVITAARRLHFAHHPGGGLPGAARKQLLLLIVLRDQPGIGQEAQQRTVVVKHFFEMRDGPGRIHRVARKAAAELVVNAAAAHLLEREAGHVSCIPARIFITRFGIAAQAEFDHLRMRKFRRLAETAAHRIEGVGNIVQGRVDRFAAEIGGSAAGRARFAAFQRRQQLRILLTHFGRALAVILFHPFQQIGEARQAITRRFREISAAEKRRGVRRQKHGQRPAAGALGEHRMRRLVDLVDIGPLLAIDLDIDEQRVHQCRHVFILERFMRHHMAPVASGIADRQQNRLATVARQDQGFRAPFMPVDRVIGMLLKIGRRAIDESIGHNRSYLSSQEAPCHSPSSL